MSREDTIAANPHSFEIGDLVEYRHTEDYGDGAMEIISGRLWVAGRIRDSDGMPLYVLSQSRLENVGIRCAYLNEVSEFRSEE